MKRLRLLRRYLNAQLALIYAGRPQSAADLNNKITILIQSLESASVQGPEHLEEQLNLECQQLNQLVLEHFEVESGEIRATLQEVQLQQELKKLEKNTGTGESEMDKNA